MDLRSAALPEKTRSVAQESKAHAEGRAETKQPQRTARQDLCAQLTVRPLAMVLQRCSVHQPRARPSTRSFGPHPRRGKKWRSDVH